MFAAIIMRGSRAAPQELATGQELLAALMPFSQADTTGVWHADNALIAQATWHNTPESLHEKAPEICPDTGRVIASWVRLDNRAELCAALGLEEAATLTDPQIILAAHREWGRACSDRLDGDFSFVIYDPNSHEAFCARDTMGAKPFYYVLTDAYFLAATSAAALKIVRSLDLTPNVQWAALYAAGLNFAHSESAYETVRKLPSAHDLVVGREGPAEPRKYFEFDLAAPHATHRDPVWVDRYRAAFDRAVDVRARSQFLVGAESSGGLDSSSIIARLAEAVPHGRDDFHTFALVCMEDETEKLMAASTMCDVRHTHVLYRPEMLRMDDAFERALTAMGHPPEHGQTLIYPTFFEQCQSLGIRTMHSGFGGDEIVTNHAHNMIDELHVRGEHGAVLAELPGTLPARIVRLAKRMRRGPDDPAASMRRLIDYKLSIACLRRDFLEDTGLRKRIDHWAVPERSEFTLNTLAGLEAGFQFARPARLESSALFAATYGVEYRYPLLDRRLIQQFFATPSIEKRCRDMGRHLHRRAMVGRIPDSIVWQRTKDMGGFLGGKPAHKTAPVLEFDELPQELQTIMDPQAFAQIQNKPSSAADATNDTAMRTRLFLWQVRQLSTWLERG